MFETLKFRQHPLDSKGVIAAKTFDNGWEVSVIQGKKFYSDGATTYEVMVIPPKDADVPRGFGTESQQFWDRLLPEFNGDGCGVFGWLDVDDVDDLMQVIASLTDTVDLTNPYAPQEFLVIWRGDSDVMTTKVLLPHWQDANTVTRREWIDRAFAEEADELDEYHPYDHVYQLLAVIAGGKPVL